MTSLATLSLVCILQGRFIAKRRRVRHQLGQHLDKCANVRTLDHDGAHIVLAVGFAIVRIFLLANRAHEPSSIDVAVEPQFAADLFPLIGPFFHNGKRQPSVYAKCPNP